MKQFKFKDYVFKHMFPYYYKQYDTYKVLEGDDKGKGILERFIDVCSEYLDKEVIPDIDNFMDILDIDKTPDIFLNYFWEYFDYIPYAYGVLTDNTPYTKENAEIWFNSSEGFPKANTRNILKYAIALYKIRCTDDFYNILGRFYGVKFELSLSDDQTQQDNPETRLLSRRIKSVPLSEQILSSSLEDNIVVATYRDSDSEDDVARYFQDSGEDVCGGFRQGFCESCTFIKLKVIIPEGMYEKLFIKGYDDDEGLPIYDTDKLEQVKLAFYKLINKYLPVHVQFHLDEDGNSTEIEIPDTHTPDDYGNNPYYTTIIPIEPASIPQINTKADITLPQSGGNIPEN